MNHRTMRKASDPMNTSMLPAMSPVRSTWMMCTAWTTGFSSGSSWLKDSANFSLAPRCHWPQTSARRDRWS